VRELTDRFRSVEFVEPVDAGLRCRHCLQPILASGVYMARSRVGLPPQSAELYDWVHEGGSKTCAPPRPAEPIDARMAHMAVEQARDERAAVAHV